MTELTGSLVVVTQAVVDCLIANADTLGVDSNKGIFYGDQNQIPITPALCVEPDNKAQDYKGTGTSRYRQIFTVYVLCYHSKVQSPQSNRKDADTMAEKIQAVLHIDRTYGGIVVDMYVSSIASGYAPKEGELMRASRLTLTGQSQTLIG